MNPVGGDGSGDGRKERRGGSRIRARGPWTSSYQGGTSLRRPHHAASGGQTGSLETGGEPTDQRDLDKSFEDIVQNSTLSVHAAEFVPKSYPIKQAQQQQLQQQQQQQYSSVHLPKHSVQHRLQMARGEVQNPESNYNTSQHCQADQVQQINNISQQVNQSLNIQDYGTFDGGSGDYKNKHDVDEDDYIIEFANTTQNLMSVVHSLILNPGRFTSIVPPLINNLRPYLESPSQFREIMQIIIQQSINEGNFRYSGARLCASLDSNLSATERTPFRWNLYNLCKSEADNLTSNWQQKDIHTEEDQKKCQGLILFLAELVIQMEHSTAFGLGDLLIQLIIVILRKPAPNSVKTICQALKLAGHTLEKSENRKEMENMMRALMDLVTEGKVDIHVGRMVHSVQELRTGNWGQTPSTPLQSSEIIDLDQALDEPVFYGPDGKVLTAEENKFLEDVADSTGNNEDNIIPMYEGDEKWITEDDMDDDIDEALDEFLKNIPKQIKNQTHK
ncbi:uncharacterized protein LOC108625717 isoform X2 [Ceratina calcarata]|uniref:Uncharacterized protein LOC108625717 isoform X2 n=1 Tax=Ceratina calcarata TaxID=156304 RepID=A0AAJ7J0Y8_9HYME|nr:uncharacterized protein LOC108625717 isoform X2 [Ceratina calcarata]